MVRQNLFSGLLTGLKRHFLGTIFVTLSVLLIFIWLDRREPATYTVTSALQVFTSISENFEDVAEEMFLCITSDKALERISKNTDMPLEELKKPESISLKATGMNHVTLSVSSVNPDKLQALSNNLIQELSENFLTQASDASEFKKGSLKERLDSVQAEIDKLEKQKKALCASLPQTASERELQKDEKALGHKEELISEMEKRLVTMPKTVFYDARERMPEYQRYYSELLSEKSHLTRLYERYMEKHPRVIGSKEKIRDLEDKLSSSEILVRKEKKNAEYSDLLQLIAKEKEEAAQMNKRYEAAFNNFSMTEARKQEIIQSFSLQIDSLKGIYRDLYDEWQRTSLEKSSASGKIKIAQKPSMPKMNGLSRQERFWLSVLAGLLLSAFLFYAPPEVEYQGFSEDFAENLATAVAKSVTQTLVIAAENSLLPNLSGAPVRDSGYLRMIPEETKYGKRYRAQSGGADIRLIPLAGGSSKFEDEYNRLAHALRVYMSDHMGRVLLFSAKERKSGVSAVVANLGVLLAGAGYSVCMIDANLENPALHEIFAVENSSGLSEVIKGEALLSQSIKKTLFGNLKLLPAGNYANIGAVKPLIEQEILKIIGKAKDSCEVVLVDLPPCKEKLTDSEIALAKSGSLLLVVSPEASEEGLGTFEKVCEANNIKLFGFVKGKF
ncbi:MAG: hypothetical protein GX221_02265 [Candidatus Riflebacteria bacterium]|nr:hypothetical protein [Candidatus Riflebacteria bacterium]